jgi:hypothetical protein
MNFINKSATPALLKILTFPTLFRELAISAPFKSYRLLLRIIYFGPFLKVSCSRPLLGIIDSRPFLNVSFSHPFLEIIYSRPLLKTI